MRLSCSQCEELETFARCGTHVDKETRQIIEHGRRVRETLKQPQYRPIPAAEQITALLPRYPLTQQAVFRSKARLGYAA